MIKKLAVIRRYGLERILILGGTGEARALAAFLGQFPGLEIISSLAGRTESPNLPAGQVRSGGFGGVAGLVHYLQREAIKAVIDATHPFAQHISQNAYAAAARAQVPYVSFSRRAWDKTPTDQWIEVPDHPTAAAAIPGLGARVFLTIGRQELPHYAQVPAWFLMRMIEPPGPETEVPRGELLYQRGPFTLEDELALLQHHKIDLIVSKNSGGQATYSKIVAARQLGIPVIMVQRPALPKAQQLNENAQAWQWLQTQLGWHQNCDHSHLP